MNNKGLTLVETLISAAILTIVISVLLMTNMFCFNLNSTTRNYSLAIDSAKSVMESVRSDPDYDDIFNHYNQQQIHGPGRLVVSYVDNTNPKELLVTVVVCWKEDNNRVIGECIADPLDLSNILPGADANHNGRIDSPLELTSYIAQR